MKKMILSSSIALALSSSVITSANAALSSSAILNFDIGVTTSSNYGTTFVKSGSYFGMDNGSGVIRENERIAISQDDGLYIGQTQLAGGAHGGGSNPSVGEHGIDNIWPLFKTNARQQTTSNVNIFSDDGSGNIMLDFSGWGIVWEGLNISLGGGIQDCGTGSDGICVNNGVDIGGVFDNGTGVATVTCAVDCAAGDTYTLDYTGVAQQGDPSQLGGILFSLHLEGAISAVPIPAAIWLFGSGLLGLVGFARLRKATSG